MLNRGKEGWRGFSLEWHADMLRNPAALAADAIQYTLHHGTDVRLRGRFKPYRCRWHPAGGLRNCIGSWVLGSDVLVWEYDIPKRLQLVY